MDFINIANKFKEQNIKILPRTENINLWGELTIKMNYKSHYQSNSFLNYQNIYFEDKSKEISFIAVKDNIPIFILPLFFNFENNLFFNLDEFINLPKEEFNENISNLILSIFKNYNALFINPNLWQKDKLNIIDNYEILNINLNNSIENIFSNFRKSYKSLIRKEFKDIKMFIVHKKDCSKEWEEFRNLHRFVSGRVTRNYRSWEIQKENIIRGYGLFIYFKKDEEMISGSFFDLTSSDINYSVSCTNRKYMDYTCNHKAIFEAIKFGCKKKFKNLYLGGLRKNIDDKKLRNIFFFKKGFCSNLCLNPIYKLK